MEHGVRRQVASNGSDAFGEDDLGSAHNPSRVLSPSCLLPRWTWPSPIPRRMTLFRSAFFYLSVSNLFMCESTLTGLGLKPLDCLVLFHWNFVCMDRLEALFYWFQHAGFWCSYLDLDLLIPCGDESIIGWTFYRHFMYFGSYCDLSTQHKWKKH